jgi:hypothetical protein
MGNADTRIYVIFIYNTSGEMRVSGRHSKSKYGGLL